MIQPCRYLILTVLLVLFSLDVFSQAKKEVDHREQLWFGYFNQTRFSKRFGMWLDVHYRQTGNFIERPFQFLIRPALSYYIKDNLRVNVGYAFAAHFPREGLNTTRPEHRLWQQIIWNQTYTGFATRQWIRLEERFNRKIVNDVLQDDYFFNYRIRYSLGFQIPLKGKQMVPKTPYLSFIDEIFINFGEEIVYNTFDQNRFFAGVGYQFTEKLNVQFGYMNVYQQEASGNSYISSNVLRLYFLHNLDLRKHEE